MICGVQVGERGDSFIAPVVRRFVDLRESINYRVGVFCGEIRLSPLTWKYSLIGASSISSPPLPLVWLIYRAGRRSVVD